MYKTLNARKPVVGNTDYPTKTNALIDDLKNAANLPGLPFSFNESTTAALVLGLFGGQMSINGVPTTIADGTIALTGAATNYVEHTAAGVVSKNTVGFSADKFPIAEVVTDAGSITGYTDRRNLNTMLIPGRVSIDVAGGVGTTVLTAAQWANDIIEFTGALTGNRTIEAPTTVSRAKIIRNNTTGAFTLTVKTAAGTGKAVTQGKRGAVYCDGTNVELATDDAASVGAPAVADVVLKSLIDAKGDLIVGTAADIVARLVAGINYQFLRPLSSEAAGLKWMGMLPTLNMGPTGAIVAEQLNRTLVSSVDGAVYTLPDLTADLDGSVVCLAANATMATGITLAPHASDTMVLPPGVSATLKNTGDSIAFVGSFANNRWYPLCSVIENPVGVGQTWQNMTASRALATNYTNTTGRAIAVSVGASSNIQTNITMTVGGVAMPQGGGSAVGEALFGFAIVPAGAVYRVDVGGAPGILGNGWNELR